MEEPAHAEPQTLDEFMEGAEPARPAAAEAPSPISKHKYSSLLEEVRAYFAIRQTKGPEFPDDGAVNDEARDMYELAWLRDVVKHAGMSRMWWLARVVLARYASSAIMERIFSGSGLTVSKLRARMDASTVRELMLCKYNLPLLEEMFEDEEERERFWRERLPFFKEG